METLLNLPQALPQLFDPSFSLKVVEVAKKYNELEGKPIERIPEYTIPGGPNAYHCSKISTSWTQGFFPGMIWLLTERQGLLSEAIDPSYSKDDLVRLARRWQADFKHLARPSLNHDQGFRFQLSYGRDYELTGNEEARDVMLRASDSLLDRFSDKAGCIRSWDGDELGFMGRGYSRSNMNLHYFVIIDNMMNLDMLYEATNLSGNSRYADVATQQAQKSAKTHVRPDYTTFHVVNMDQETGEGLDYMTAQGWADDSCWARGQAWAIYGFAQCAQRTGRQDFIETTIRLADVFLALLPPSGVPPWDFNAPSPCPYDASAGTIAACGLLRLASLLLSSSSAVSSSKALGEKYLKAAFDLITAILLHCAAPRASLADGRFDWGEGGWETILMHSTINGNPRAARRFMDHGLVYADYYLIEFGNEALKLQQRVKTASA